MIEKLKPWWNDREPRERLLLSIMFALIAGVLLWLGVYRPVEAGLRNAALDNLEASERHADVAYKIDLLRRAGERPKTASSLPVEQIVGQSAGEAGFTLERVQAQGEDRVEVAIASARSTALLGWIAGLEAQGVAVDRVMISPSGATGTVSAQLGFRRAGR